jgi:hypothetical protein
MVFGVERDGGVSVTVPVIRTITLAVRRGEGGGRGRVAER